MGGNFDDMGSDEQRDAILGSVNSVDDFADMDHEHDRAMNNEDQHHVKVTFSQVLWNERLENMSQDGCEPYPEQLRLLKRKPNPHLHFHTQTETQLPNDIAASLRLVRLLRIVQLFSFGWLKKGWIVLHRSMNKHVEDLVTAFILVM